MFTRSPFPGMDPWLEGYWNDVHHRVIEEIADQLASGLPGNLYVSVESDLYVVDPTTPMVRGIIRPDASVAARPGSDDGGVTVATEAVAEPIRILVDDEPVSLGHLEIRGLGDGNPLVTAVEVFSPTNKQGRQARADYIRKRQTYHRGGANVVELDLLRGGRHLVDVSLASLRPEEVSAYRCCVRRAVSTDRPVAEYYPLPLRERLPRIRVPLRPTDVDAVVDLQQPIDVVYARRQLGRRIDYDRPPTPRLSRADAAWAADRVAVARRERV